jgi:hypothetical protein
MPFETKQYGRNDPLRLWGAPKIDAREVYNTESAGSMGRVNAEWGAQAANLVNRRGIIPHRTNVSQDMRGVANLQPVTIPCTNVTEEK